MKRSGRRHGVVAASAALGLAFVMAACAPATPPAPVVTAPPPPQPIIVERGQTLSGIAHAYHVPMLALADANHLSPPYRIRAGQTLIVPVSAAPEAAASPLAMTEPTLPSVSYPPVAAPPAPVVTQPLAPPAPVSPPQTIPLDHPPPPSAAGPSGPLTPPAATAPPDRLRPSPPAAAMPTQAAALSPPPGRSDNGAPPRAQSAAAEQPSAAHGGTEVVWPVNEAFGAGPDGTRNDGINIAAAKGAAIEAADDGIVAYAGNELRGYGNLILIKHPNGFISAYAHCDVILVKTGQKVGRGQVIARVGATGNVDTPQLHFELRRGKKPVDPRQYLASPATAGSERNAPG
jgi:murein DD-endopeptidase MepM/ murein hydrolase activator NlpD